MLFHREPQAWGQLQHQSQTDTSTHLYSLKTQAAGAAPRPGAGGGFLPRLLRLTHARILSAPRGSFPLWPPFPEALPPAPHVCLPGGSCVSATALLAPSHRLRDREPPCPASRACGTCSHNVPIKDSSNFFDVCSSRLPSHMIDGLSSDIIFA